MDILDYIINGMFGCTPLSSKELYEYEVNGDSPIENIRSTYRASRDAHYVVTKQLFESGRAMYYDSNDEIGTRTIIGTTVQNYNLLNNVFVEWCELYADFAIKGEIFWNAILPYDHEYKRKGIEQFDYFAEDTIKSIEEKTTLTFMNSLDYYIYYESGEKIVTVDFSDKQFLTREIYNSYIDAIADLLYKEKELYKMLTNTDFEEFIPPDNWDYYYNRS